MSGYRPEWGSPHGQFIFDFLGDSFLVGTDANDTILANAGNDTVIGSGGHDTLFLGAGADVALFAPEWRGFGDDMIGDFNPAEDKLLFRAGYDATNVTHSVTTHNGQTGTMVLAGMHDSVWLPGVTLTDTNFLWG